MIIIGLESRQMELAGEEIAIGRDAAATLSLAGDHRVQSRHAVLRRVATRWLIEAADGVTIRVGDGRPTKVAWLNAGDVIHLTEAGPTLTFCPNGAVPAPATAAPAVAAAAPEKVSLLDDSGPIRLAQPVPDNKSPAKLENDAFDIPPELLKDFDGSDESPRTPALSRADLAVPDPAATKPNPPPSDVKTVVLAMSAVVVLLGLLAISFWPRAKLESPSPPGFVTAPVLAPVAPVDPAPKQPELPAVKPVAADKPPSAVYLVRMSAPDQDQTFRLGAAWAIDKRRLATSGSIGLGVQQNRELLPKVTVQSVDKSPPVAVTDVRIHPEYRKVSAKAMEAKTELDESWAAVDDADEETIPEEMQPQMLAAQSRLLDALQEQLDFDLAILEVGEDLPHVLPVARDLAGLRPGATIRLIGLPFPMDELLVDPDAALAATTITGQIQVKVPSGGDGVRHWLAKFKDAAPQDNWIGSPVLNAQGEAIGLYCQPSPPTEIRDDYVPSTHEIIAIDRVAEITADE
jgi:hypothetical protein